MVPGMTGRTVNRHTFKSSVPSASYAVTLLTVLAIQSLPFIDSISSPAADGCHSQSSSQQDCDAASRHSCRHYLHGVLGKFFAKVPPSSTFLRCVTSEDDRYIFNGINHRCDWDGLFTGHRRMPLGLVVVARGITPASSENSSP